MYSYFSHPPNTHTLALVAHHPLSPSRSCSTRSATQRRPDQRSRQPEPRPTPSPPLSFLHLSIPAFTALQHHSSPPRRSQRHPSPPSSPPSSQPHTIPAASPTVHQPLHNPPTRITALPNAQLISPSTRAPSSSLARPSATQSTSPPPPVLPSSPPISSLSIPARLHPTLPTTPPTTSHAAQPPTTSSTRSTPA